MSRVTEMLEAGVTDPEQRPADKSFLDAWRIVSMVRDGALVGMAMLLCWTVWTVQQQQVDLATIKASRFTIQDAYTLKDGFVLSLNSQAAATDAKMDQLRALLAQVANDTAEIKGRLSMPDAAPKR